MSKTSDYMLTTRDNPYNPYTHWEDWYKFDMIHGYDCCGLLDRKALTSPLFSDEMNQEEIYRAIDEIVENEPILYRKISKEDKVGTSSD